MPAGNRILRPSQSPQTLNLVWYVDNKNTKEMYIHVNIYRRWHNAIP